MSKFRAIYRCSMTGLESCGRSVATVDQADTQFPTSISLQCPFKKRLCTLNLYKHYITTTPSATRSFLSLCEQLAIVETEVKIEPTKKRNKP